MHTETAKGGHIGFYHGHYLPSFNFKLRMYRSLYTYIALTYMLLHALRRHFQSVYVCMYILYIPDLKSKNLLLVGINTSPAMYCISKLYTIVGCLDMSGADALCWLNIKNNTKQTRTLLITFGYIQPLLYYIIGACGIIGPTEPQHYTVHCIFPLQCLMYTV